MSFNDSFLKSSFITIVLFSGHLTFALPFQTAKPEYSCVASYCSDHVAVVNLAMVLSLFIQNLNPLALRSTKAQLYLSPSFNTALFNFVSPSLSFLSSSLCYLNCLQILQILNF